MDTVTPLTLVGIKIVSLLLTPPIGGIPDALTRIPIRGAGGWGPRLCADRPCV